MWFWWLIIVLYALEVVGKIVSIGETRKPITKGDAAVVAVAHGLLIWGIVYYGMLR